MAGPELLDEVLSIEEDTKLGDPSKEVSIVEVDATEEVCGRANDDKEEEEGNDSVVSVVVAGLVPIAK